MTKFLDEHPGGKRTLLSVAGKDATEQFDMLHDESVLPRVGAQYQIGVVGDAPSAGGAAGPGGGTPSSTGGGGGGGTEASWDCGGTAGVLPAERAKATFNVADLTLFLDGGDPKKTAKRHWIVDAGEGWDASGKYYKTRAEVLKDHLASFIGIHKEFAEQGYRPEREEVAWMSANSAHKGTLMNHYGLPVSPETQCRRTL